MGHQKKVVCLVNAYYVNITKTLTAKNVEKFL